MHSSLSDNKVPAFRLSGFYFFYFALMGALLPYWSLYLQDLQFDAATIGFLMGMVYFSRIFAPALWGYLADTTGQRIKIIRLGTLMTWLIFSLVLWNQSVVFIAVIMLSYSFFWNAILPQFEVVTLDHLAGKESRYSQIRLWGSVGFIIAVMGVGYALEVIDIRWLPYLLVAIMIGIWGFSLITPQKKQRDSISALQSAESFRKVISKPQVIAFFIVILLVQISHGPYYTFYSILMKSHGYSTTEVGWLWTLGVCAEIVLFIFMHQVISTFSLRAILLTSLLLCVTRWLVTAIWPEHLIFMLMSQLLHAATFGAIHTVGITLINLYFPSSMKGRGQALFSSIGFGVGGSIGAFLSGYLWDVAGATVTFMMASGAAMLGFLLAYVWIHPQKVQQKSV